MKAIDDSLPLSSNARALKVLPFCFCFRGFHFADLGRLRFVSGSDTLALGGIDAVHGSFNGGVRSDLSDEAALDRDAVAFHGFAEAFLDGVSDLLLLGKHAVEGELGHAAANLVKDEAGELPVGGGEPVEIVVHGQLVHLREGRQAGKGRLVSDFRRWRRTERRSAHGVLDGDDQLDEDVVRSLALDADVDLLQTERHGSGDVLAHTAVHQVAPSWIHPLVPPALLHH